MSSLTKCESAMLDLLDWLAALPEDVLIRGGSAYNVGCHDVTGCMIYAKGLEVMRLILKPEPPHAD